MKENSEPGKNRPEIKKSREFEKFSKTLKEQYNTQKEIFLRSRILKELRDGKPGIKAIDDKEYHFPEKKDLLNSIEENWEVIKRKYEQGFTQLLIVPFGMKLGEMINIEKDLLLKHYLEGKLFASKKDPEGNNVPLKINKKNPFKFRARYQGVDEVGGIVYFPEKFSEPHNGKAKKRILKETGQAFICCLIEDLPDIPEQGRGITIGGRKQLERNKAPDEYLKIIQKDQNYKHEQGFTPECEITNSILYLEQTNRVVVDTEQYDIGSCWTDYFIPLLRWERDSAYNLVICYYDVAKKNRGSHTFVEIPISKKSITLPSK